MLCIVFLLAYAPQRSCDGSDGKVCARYRPSGCLFRESQVVTCEHEPTTAAVSQGETHTETFGFGSVITLITGEGNGTNDKFHARAFPGQGSRGV